MSIINAVNAYFSKVLGHLNDLDVYRLRFTGVLGSTIQKVPLPGAVGVSAQTLINDRVAIVDTDQQALAAKGEAESFQDVFDNWTRISHEGVGPYPARVGELSGWTFNNTTNVINCTTNSSSLVGFISPDRHDNFVFEVTVKAPSDGDDDSIGICLAYTEVDGQEHTIVALRTPGGTQTGMLPAHPDLPVTHNGKLLDIYYDIFHPTNRLDLGSTNGGLMWGDGNTYPEDTVFAPERSSPWNNFLDGCRIKVTRTGDDFVVETSNLNSTIYVPTARVEFSLNDDPALAKFKGPQRYGYVAFSQAGSTWDTHTRPLATGVVYNVQSQLLEVYENATWVTYPPSSLSEYVDSGLFYYNTSSEKLYWTEADGSVISLPLERL